MPRVDQQQGITAISVLIIFVLAGFGIFLVFKLAPVYIESYSVSNSVTSLKQEYDLKDKSKEEILRLLQKRFELNDVKNVNLKDDVKIQKAQDKITVSVAYEVRVPLFSNINLALTFNNREEFH